MYPKFQQTFVYILYTMFSCHSFFDFVYILYTSVAYILYILYILVELHMLIQRFPRVITDMNALESEFEYQANPDDKFQAYFDTVNKLMHTDHNWHQISKEIGLYPGQPCFKHLTDF